MTRRLLVNLLALLVIALVGGAASAQNQGRNAVEQGAPEATPSVDLPPPAAVVDDGAEEGVGADAAQSAEAVGEDDDEDGFGVIRSQEVRAFGECMDAAAGDHAARAGCADLRPGPAHLNPAHPNHGRVGGQGVGARPDHAGRPDHGGGPPDHPGRPAHAGPPAHAGQGGDPEG